MNNNDQLANSIVKALAYTENGGKPDPNKLSAGKSGELKSVFQFTPDTWKADAEQVLGDKYANMNPDTETYVVQQKVKNWLQQGKSPQQIASMWNAGEGEPDAYTGKFSNGKSSTGINKENVNYSVSDYVSKFDKYLNDFSGGQGNTQTQNPKIQGNVDALLSLVKNAAANKTTAQKPTSPPGAVQGLIPESTSQV